MSYSIVILYTSVLSTVCLMYPRLTGTGCTRPSVSVLKNEMTSVNMPVAVSLSAMSRS